MILTGEIQGWIPRSFIIRITEDTLLTENRLYKGTLNADGSFSIDPRASGYFDEVTTPF